MEGVGEEKEGYPTWGRALLSLLSIMRMHERPQLEPDVSIAPLPNQECLPAGTKASY
jgi:hypothetical protein